jgi:hypothetical protein
LSISLHLQNRVGNHRKYTKQRTDNYRQVGWEKKMTYILAKLL